MARCKDAYLKTSHQISSKSLRGKSYRCKWLSRKTPRLAIFPCNSALQQLTSQSLSCTGLDYKMSNYNQIKKTKFHGSLLPQGSTQWLRPTKRSFLVVPKSDGQPISGTHGRPLNASSSFGLSRKTAFGHLIACKKGDGHIPRLAPTSALPLKWRFTFWRNVGTREEFGTSRRSGWCNRP